MSQKTYTGYTFWVNACDYFYETDRKYRTLSLAIEIVERVFNVHYKDAIDAGNYILSRLQHGNMTIRSDGFYKFTGSDIGIAGMLSSGDMRVYLKENVET